MFCSAAEPPFDAVQRAWPLSHREERILAIAALERLGIEQTALQAAGSLSGGQQQRVAIARALMQEPKMLLADERSPRSTRSRKIVMDSLRDINEREGITVITNLHTLDTARSYCERIIRLGPGPRRVRRAARCADRAGGLGDLRHGPRRRRHDESMTSTALPASASQAGGPASPRENAMATA